MINRFPTTGPSETDNRGKELNSKRILITGGAGFIGSNFIRFLLKNSDYEKIVILDALTYAGNLANLSDVIDDPRIRFIEGDIANAREVDRAISGCNHVVNFAAETHVDRSLDSADPFIHSNIVGVYVLLEKAKQADVEKFIQISTDEVYGPILSGSADENYPLNPSSPYSASKVSGDALCNSYRVSFGVPTMLIRPTNNYGPYQFPEKLIPFFVKKAINGEKVPVYGEGKQQRDWLHVDDNCGAIYSVLQKGEPGEIYNVGADNHRENIDVTKKILKSLDLPEELIEYVTDRLGHDFRYAVDSTKIRKLGWSPRVSFEKGLEETVKWFANHFGGKD